MFLSQVQLILSTFIRVLSLMTTHLSVGYFSSKLFVVFLISRPDVILYHNVTILHMPSCAHVQKNLDEKYKSVKISS